LTRASTHAETICRHEGDGVPVAQALRS
jgi:hypothetical protein